MYAKVILQSLTMTAEQFEHEKIGRSWKTATGDSVVFRVDEPDIVPNNSPCRAGSG